MDMGKMTMRNGYGHGMKACIFWRYESFFTSLFAILSAFLLILSLLILRTLHLHLHLHSTFNLYLQLQFQYICPTSPPLLYYMSTIYLRQ
jgi:hypothetical protein